jgi:hypothetical protein
LDVGILERWVEQGMVNEFGNTRIVHSWLS